MIELGFTRGIKCFDGWPLSCVLIALGRMPLSRRDRNEKALFLLIIAIFLSACGDQPPIQDLYQTLAYNTPVSSDPYVVQMVDKISQTIQPTKTITPTLTPRPTQTSTPSASPTQTTLLTPGIQLTSPDLILTLIHRSRFHISPL